MRYLSLREILDLHDRIIEISGTDGKLTGFEILKASTKINIDIILSYTLKLDKNILQKKTA